LAGYQAVGDNGNELNSGIYRPTLDTAFNDGGTQTLKNIVRPVPSLALAARRWGGSWQQDWRMLFRCRPALRQAQHVRQDFLHLSRLE
jgi:hypothetical protein